MKLKLLFLGMLGAALMVSCNNDVIENGGGNTNPDAPQEGLPVYASMSIKLGNGANTYAGGGDVASSANEAQLKDVAMYVYKSDASGTTPQCAIYIAAIGTSGANGENNTVTLKTTSGTKKIFVAANVKSNPTTTDMVTTAGLGVVSSTLTPTAVALNATLYSTSATAFSTTAPTATIYADVADGLIKNFAMSDIYGTGLGTYSTASAHAPFMSNWDGPDDEATAPGTTNLTSASFNLYPDIDSVGSRPTFPSPTYDANKNQLNIYVQRAFAKVSLKFGFAATNLNAPTVPAGLVNKYYGAAVGEDSEGRFFPWGTGTSAVWSLGNITTAELPFQQYINGIPQDMFYLNTNDSVPQTAAAYPANLWLRHYDNTRVFPFSATLNTYPNDNIKVTNTKSTMTLSGNSQTFTADNEATQTSYNYAYAIENARRDPVVHDHETYVVVGGFYQPKKVLTSINRSKVNTNAPVFGYNGAVLTGTESPGASVSGVDYSWVPAAGDTLYYVADDKIFISGKANLVAYYAWATTQMVDQTAGDAWLLANPLAPAVTAAAVYAAGEFDPAVAVAINAEMTNDILFAYFEGQCFYRIFIVNDSAPTSAVKVSVLRNHIYDVKISSIKGPGISDPNKIIIPGKPVLEQDTYVSATINVLKWHKVDQSKDVDNQ